jgi:hypothetical protein
VDGETSFTTASVLRLNGTAIDLNAAGLEISRPSGALFHTGPSII